ncbi:hypothetical protein NAEGRDRAFT_81396 [Naegleria gruberi]|uniref:Mediator of RNA polymerase II transcription subunit 11 n=1 Tax=Naegleria gruberi TaxID=5762 RepID=D2VVM6_NAEGR|nr:uncharacterized protein NAEGRDRAFT_81396 [Naegleria gruberi]EFC39068.1 hypothetical protein NAEGRDRAFT_81396 [Naegleria gruberi]|eukprot:XP_002671812.1 hypothetical protein NAEGRDRAFT_81396 [Naegleria gruberi strain NEG-M]
MNNNQTLISSSDLNGNLMEQNQLKEEIQNDSASVMTGNEDNMDTNDDGAVEIESSDDEDDVNPSEKEYLLVDHPNFASLQREKDRVLYLLELGMTFIESLTKATRENMSVDEAISDCKDNISDYYDTLSEIKTNMSKLICMSSFHSPLNYEGSLYSERKRIEINNKKAKILKFETSIGKSGAYNDDFSSVNAFNNNNNNLDNISQSNISYGHTAQTPNKM